MCAGADDRVDDRVGDVARPRASYLRAHLGQHRAAGVAACRRRARWRPTPGSTSSRAPRAGRVPAQAAREVRHGGLRRAVHAEFGTARGRRPSRRGRGRRGAPASAAASRSSMNTRPVRMRPRTLTSIICSHSATSACSNGAPSITPAFATTRSTRPSSARTVSATRWTSSGSAMSAVMGRTPSRAWRRSARRATAATRAPSCASRWAVAAPMPLLAPVTTATRPSSDLVMPFTVLAVRLP